MRYSRIVATGHYLPERVLTNDELERMVETSDAWIRARTGIRQRHIAAPTESVAGMGERASRMALETAGLTAQDIDLIVMGTTTPDQVFPNSAVIMQERLGVAGIPAFSLEAACSGFIYALAVADNFIRAGSAHRVLVVGAEKMSSIIDWNDRATCVLFGDGAGAVIVEHTPTPGIIDTRLHADGRYKDLLQFPSGIASSKSRIAGDALQMKGSEVFRVAVAKLGEEIVETLARHDLDGSAVDWLVPHQANARIISAIARRLKLPMERVVLTVGEHGNTSSASVPLALDAAIRDGRIQRGDLLLLEAFGGGFTWGSALVRY